MGKKLAYFIDYDEDEVVPLGANPALVDKYEEISKKINRRIVGRYDTRREMMYDVAECTPHAPYGAVDYETLSNEEMQKKIDEFVKLLEEHESWRVNKLVEELNNLSKKDREKVFSYFSLKIDPPIIKN